MRKQNSSVMFFTLIAIASSVSAQTGAKVPALETIVARMAQARAENRQRFRSYVVTREYKLFGKDSQTVKSQVIATVAFVPPGSKKYAFQKSSGAALGERIVGRMLESEAEIAKDYDATDISPNNYDFRFIRVEELAGQRCYVIELRARRKDRNLVHGTIWVDADTYLLHRTEGEPAKSLSWWVRDVRMVFLYSDVEGMWLQTASEATAYVRILGQHTIAARNVKYDIDELVFAESQEDSLARQPRVDSKQAQLRLAK
jgi:outer membrane lipoprotein-sorting protein